MIDTIEQQELEYEIRSVGMTLDEAREHIKNSQSYKLESPEQYILGQLALVQDLSNGGNHSASRHTLNRLRMAIVENFKIEKVKKEKTKL